MGHYDCSNCGLAMGIDYGSCPECTPAWVLEAKREFEKRQAEVREQVKRKYQDIINDEIWEILASEREEYELIFEAGRDWYKNKINNEQP